MEIEIFHQQKQLIFSNIQTCVIMLNWKTQLYFLYRDIDVQQCQCQGHTVLSTDTTCRYQTNTFGATVRLESLDAHISAIENGVVLLRVFIWMVQVLYIFIVLLIACLTLVAKSPHFNNCLMPRALHPNTVYKQEKSIFKF